MQDKGSYPCTICHSACLDNENSLCCDDCDNWTHLKCTNLSFKRFKFLSNSNSKFY